MNRTTVLSLNKINVFKSLDKNKTFIFMAFCFLIGLIIGCLMYSEKNKIGDISLWMFERYISSRENLKFFKIFWNSVFSNFLIILILYLFGVSIMGIVVAPFSLMWIGIFYGGICSHLYGVYELKGIAFNATVFIPSTVILIFLCIFAVKESMQFSIKIVSLTLPKTRPINLAVDFKAFTLKYLVYILFLILNALIDSAVFSAFYHFYKF